jgi:hypothetical protein
MLDLIQLHNQILVLLFFILLLLIGIFIESFFIGIVNTYKSKINSLLFSNLNSYSKFESNILKRSDLVLFDNYSLFNKLKFTPVIKKSVLSNLINYFTSWLIFSFTEVNKNTIKNKSLNINLIYTKDILLEFL